MRMSEFRPIIFLPQVELVASEEATNSEQLASNRFPIIDARLVPSVVLAVACCDHGRSIFSVV